MISKLDLLKPVANIPSGDEASSNSLDDMMIQARALGGKRNALSTLVGSLARSVMLSQQPRAMPCISPAPVMVHHAVPPVTWVPRVSSAVPCSSGSHESQVPVLGDTAAPASISNAGLDVNDTIARLSSAISRVEALEEQLRGRVSELGEVLESLTDIQHQSADRLQRFDSALLKLEHLSDRK